MQINQPMLIMFQTVLYTPKNSFGYFISEEIFFFKIIQWRIQNIFYLRSPLYRIGSCPLDTVEHSREKYSGYAIGMTYIFIAKSTLVLHNITMIHIHASYI
jgi:hypothetical protein